MKQHLYIDFDIDKARAAVIPDSAEVKTTMGILRRGERYREALQKIASCSSNFPGDVVDVARKALAGD